MGAAPGIGAAVAFQGAAGVGNGLENVASNTLIQRHVAPAMLGRVFGLVGTAAYAGSGIAALYRRPLSGRKHRRGPSSSPAVPEGSSPSPSPCAPLSSRSGG